MRRGDLCSGGPTAGDPGGQPRDEHGSVDEAWQDAGGGRGGRDRAHPSSLTGSAPRPVPGGTDLLIQGRL